MLIGFDLFLISKADVFVHVDLIASFHSFAVLTGAPCQKRTGVYQWNATTGEWKLLFEVIRSQVMRFEGLLSVV